MIPRCSSPDQYSTLGVSSDFNKQGAPQRLAYTVPKAPPKSLVLDSGQLLADDNVVLRDVPHCTKYHMNQPGTYDR